MQTPLYNDHCKLDGKIVDFAGWDLPVMYTSIIDEHTATRTRAGLFDVSHMCEFRVSGSQAAAFLKKMIPTRLNKLEPHKSMYSVFCNEKGGIVDDLFVYMINDNEFYIVANAGTHEKDRDWLQENLVSGVTLDDESAGTAKIDLQGPRAREILQHVITDPALGSLKRFRFDFFTYGNKPVMISQSGYTGEFGYELYLPADIASSLWNSLLDAGQEQGLKPVGLGARDTLRLESCYSLYGHELTDDVSPIEAGLGWLVSSTEQYIGREALDKETEQGAQRELIAFELIDRGVPRDGQDVLSSDTVIGKVTSGTFSPTFKKGIGMALVDARTYNSGDNIFISIRGKNCAAKVVQRPFYQYNNG